MAKFIDVYDGDCIEDFVALKNQGICGIVTKVLQGCTGVQKYYDYRYRKCKEIGIPIGFYHWLSSKSEPEDQAVKYYSLTKDYDNDILHMLDIEGGGEVWSASITPENYARRFLSKYKQLSGNDMLIYSGRCFIEENFSADFQANHLWWIAEYGSQCRVPINCRNNFVAWQYSESGRLNGMTTAVDLDILYQPNKFYTKNYTPSAGCNNVVIDNLNCNEKVKQIQRVCNLDGAGLAEDGLWGPLTESAVSNLPVAGLPYKTPNLTTWVQLRLGINADGIFGTQTRDAVIEWQNKHGLSADGIVGINTIKSLCFNDK